MYRLILLTLVLTVHCAYDNGICQQCKSFLNSIQCVKSGCSWQKSNNTCFTKHIKNLNTTSNATNITDSAAEALLFPTCASQTQGCYGNDGRDLNQVCTYDYNNNCVGVDVTRACHLKHTQYECQIFNICDWNIKNQSCKIRSCATIQESDLCTFLLDSIYLVKPCKWIPNTSPKPTKANAKTAGICVDGEPSDISHANCMIDIPMAIAVANYPQYGVVYFTYNNATKQCTACNESRTNPLLQSLLISFNLMLVVLLFQ